MNCGLLLVLLEMEIDPLKLPVAVGANVTLIVHDALGVSARGAMGQLLVSENGEGWPGGVMLLISTLTVPLFLRRADLTLLVVPTA